MDLNGLAQFLKLQIPSVRTYWSILRGKGLQDEEILRKLTGDKSAKIFSCFQRKYSRQRGREKNAAEVRKTMAQKVVAVKPEKNLSTDKALTTISEIEFFLRSIKGGDSTKIVRKLNVLRKFVFQTHDFED